MFENILGQETIVALLREQLRTESVPRATLFHGLPYTGKSSTALELARCLGCQNGDAAWNCGCPSCTRHRLLTHPNLMMLGGRYFDVEVAASADAFARTRVPATRFLFIRAVRKLLRRFDPILVEKESPAVRRLVSTVSEIEEILDEPELSAKHIERIVESATKLGTATSTGNIPVSQVRAITTWARMTGGSKLVLMENADTIHESARNALLKLLEEPPSGVHIVLTATRQGALMATLRSRLRPYHFGDRETDVQRQVLTRIFREESEEYPTLRDYFLAWRDLSPNMMRGLAARFLDLARQPAADPSVPGLATALIADALKSGKPGESLVLFAEELLQVIRQKTREDGLDLTTAERWTRLIRDQILYAGAYNPSASLIMDSLLLRMRRSAAGAA